ncbi:MAG: hypothetical protein E6Q97_36215 [Desulfurellales bacterium]|nr:MAG: hypothetical protein E6Q97_36215 [Desulfurellales bacterium]
MSLDQDQAVAGYHRVGAPDTSGGFPAGASIGTRAGFVPGAAAATGGALYMTPSNMSGTTPTLATSGTISHNGCGVAQVLNAGATTGNIIQKGTHPGQVLMVINQGTGSVTMAAVATSNVAQGMSAVIPAGAASLFVWNHIDARWYGVEGV